jgi:hypothetical protein
LRETGISKCARNPVLPEMTVPEAQRLLDESLATAKARKEHAKTWEEYLKSIEHENQT